MKHPKMHIDQINKDQTQRTNIKSSKGKTTNNTQGNSHKDNSWSFNRNSSGQKGMAGWKKITYSPDYCTQQGSHSNMKEKSKALQTKLYRVGDGQGGPAYCSLWSCRESDMTEQLNWTELFVKSDFLACFQ